MGTARLLLGSSNDGKIGELRALFQGSREVVGLKDLNRPAPEVEEDGSTYRENAHKKAESYFHWSGLPTVADDSGLEVEALGNAPGLYSARFGGEALSWPERWDHLVLQLKGHPQPWVARFRCVLCYFDGKAAHFFEGVAAGKILDKPTGSGGFGYDPIVFIDALQKTFAEASTQEKNLVSHRAIAFRSLRDWLDRAEGRS